MSEWKVMVDPLEVPSTYTDKTPHVMCWAACCRIWNVSLIYPTGSCKLCGERPRKILTDGDQIRLEDKE